MARTFLLLAALTACGPDITSQTPRSISFGRVRDTNLDEATKAAQKHCDENGRDAEIQGSIDDKGNVSFKCVDRGTPAKE